MRANYSTKSQMFEDPRHTFDVKLNRGKRDGDRNGKIDTLYLRPVLRLHLRPDSRPNLRPNQRSLPDPTSDPTSQVRKSTVTVAHLCPDFFQDCFKFTDRRDQELKKNSYSNMSIFFHKLQQCLMCNNNLLP